MTSNGHYFSATGIGLAVIAAVPGHAQEAGTENGPSQGGLQEIVVTAQKRSENLQDVPIAVTATSGEDLAARGITDTLQLSAAAPGLNIRTTAGAFQPSIRGIGTSSNVVENPVALYIDDVYLPQQREGFRQLDDIAQVAVLKGPQGTLFGRNATGGVIQITTLAPSYDFSGKLRAEIDNYATLRAGLYLTGGLSDAVAGNLSLSYADQGKGWGNNLTTGRDTFKILHEFSVRGKLLIEPSDSTTVTMIGDYADKKQLTNSFQPYQGLPLLFPGTGPLDSVYDSYAGADSFNGFKGGGVSVKIEQALGFADLVSISAYRKGIGSYQFDNAAVPQPFFIVHSPRSPSRSFSQEIQLVSPKSDTFSWVAGAFYFNYSNGSDPIRRSFGGPFTPLPTSVAVTITTAKEVTESFAPFGEVNWEFLPETRLTLGGRYTYEKRRLEDGQVIAQRVDGTAVTTLFPKAPLTVKEPTFRVALDHRFSPDILAYLSFNTGIKSGGFNIVTPANPAYLPEKLKAYEAGLKTELFDRNVRLNLAAFYYDYSNLQVIQFIGLTQQVVNGPSAKIYGLDLDFQAQLGDNFRASGGFEIKHSEFTDFNGAAFSTPRPGGGAIIAPGDASGNRLPLAQKFSASLAFDYHKELSAGALNFNVSGNYSGDYFFEADNFLRQKAYVLLNASVKWTDPSDRYSVTLWGKNLFDEKIISQVVSQSIGYPATFGNAPLTFGVTAAAEF
jgi:outer membrane receptor protein involved in Fe transport